MRGRHELFFDEDSGACDNVSVAILAQVAVLLKRRLARPPGPWRFEVLHEKLAGRGAIGLHTGCRTGVPSGTG